MSRLDSIHEVLDFRFADLQKEINSLKAENKKLVERGHAIYHTLVYFTKLSFMHEEYGFTEEKKAVNDWKELFNNDIPEPNYED